MKNSKPRWELVTDFSVAEYRCGLHAEDRVRLKRDIVVRDCDGKETGVVHKTGEIWTVLKGAKDDPGVLRRRQADGKTHFWDDAATALGQFEEL